MLRKSIVAPYMCTKLRLVGNGPTMQTGGAENETLQYANTLPLSDRGLRTSTVFHEPSTSVYDTYTSWTYFHPIDVNISKMAAPEAKYYQRFTRRPWDISSTELVEIYYRKKYFQMWFYIAAVIAVYFMIPKEKSYSGLRGADGHWILLPKGQPEKFECSVQLQKLKKRKIDELINECTPGIQ